jgi:hypothetical protein
MTAGEIHPCTMSMKKTDLEKHLAKKIAGTGSATARGNQGTALNRREQALARKRELLEKSRKSK